MKALACLLLVPLLSLAACSARPPRQSEPPPALVVASDLAHPPFAEVAEDGRPRGRDVEMMELLARGLGRSLEWRRMPFEDLLRAAELGRVDVVCATLGVTPERAERVLFTRPYFETAVAAVVRSGPGEPESLADLAGRSVAAGAGTTAERAVRLRLPRALLAPAPAKGVGAGERLATGTVDAAAMDGPAADALVAASGGRLRRLPEELAPERYALALPPWHEELRDRLDRALGVLARRGVLAELDRRYGLR